MPILYITVLCLAIAGLVVLDHRYKLALFYDFQRAMLAIGVGMALFLAWDVIGIRQGIFFVGDSSFLTGLQIAPNLPVEELFFLFLLCYNALLLVRGGERIWPRT